MKKFAIVASAIALVCSLGSNAFGATILDGALGTVRPPEPFGDEAAEDYAQFILGMTLSTTQTVGGYTYTRTGLADPGSGSVDGSVAAGDFTKGGTTSVEAGWEYVLAKYDGPNGGAVLYYLGGSAFTLEATSAGVWVNPAGAGFGLSGWVAFNPTSVPDGGSTAVLLGSVLVGFGIARRRFIKG